MINLDLSELLVADEEKILRKYQHQLNKIKTMLISKTGPGHEFTGWLKWPTEEFDQTDLLKMKEFKNKWVEMGIDTVIVIGIGGSYIGPKAGINFCTSPFLKKENGIEIIFVSGLHTVYNTALLKLLENKNWAIVVISKSGTTFETAVNFRVFRERLFEVYGDEHTERIVAITDKSKGVLKEICNKQNYQTLYIPDDIRGRYSTITSVGLFPMILAGVDIDEVIKGWKTMLYDFKNLPTFKNSAMIYAACRHYLSTRWDKEVEVFATYESNMKYIAEHYKQIFAESEGKTKKCLIPTIAYFSEDLHSIGQLYQEGNNKFFETTIMYRAVRGKCIVPESSFDNDDNLDFLQNKELIQLNYNIKTAATKAHSKGARIPNITIKLDFADAYNFGYLAAWFCIAASTSAYLLEVNPFNQPGVEAYKSEMKKLIK